MKLPATFRETLVEQMDDILGAYESAADPETVAGFLVEFIEGFGDEEGIEDITDQLEDSGNLDGSLSTVLESEFGGSEMGMTAEEIVSIFEKLCAIEWDDEINERDDDTEDFTLF